MAGLAAVVAAHKALGVRGGILVANPIPLDAALDGVLIEGFTIDQRIDQAIDDALAAGISRKEVTPYLLGRINELTGGRSLTANIALIRNNAEVAARLAAALAS